MSYTKRFTVAIVSSVKMAALRIVFLLCIIVLGLAQAVSATDPNSSPEDFSAEDTYDDPENEVASPSRNSSCTSGHEPSCVSTDEDEDEMPMSNRSLHTRHPPTSEERDQQEDDVESHNTETDPATTINTPELQLTANTVSEEYADGSFENLQEVSILGTLADRTRSVETSFHGGDSRGSLLEGFEHITSLETVNTFSTASYATLTESENFEHFASSDFRHAIIDELSSVHMQTSLSDLIFTLQPTLTAETETIGSSADHWINEHTQQSLSSLFSGTSLESAASYSTRYVLASSSDHDAPTGRATEIYSFILFPSSVDIVPHSTGSSSDEHAVEIDSVATIFSACLGCNSGQISRDTVTENNIPLPHSRTFSHDLDLTTSTSDLLFTSLSHTYDGMEAETRILARNEDSVFPRLERSDTPPHSLEPTTQLFPAESKVTTVFIHDTPGELETYTTSSHDTPSILETYTASNHDTPSTLEIHTTSSHDTSSTIETYATPSHHTPGALETYTTSSHDTAGALETYTTSSHDAAGALETYTTSSHDTPGVLETYTISSHDTPGILETYTISSYDTPGILQTYTTSSDDTQDILETYTTSSHDTQHILQALSSDIQHSLEVLSTNDTLNVIETFPTHDTLETYASSGHITFDISETYNSLSCDTHSILQAATSSSHDIQGTFAAATTSFNTLSARTSSSVGLAQEATVKSIELSSLIMRHTHTYLLVPLLSSTSIAITSTEQHFATSLLDSDRRTSSVTHDLSQLPSDLISFRVIRSTSFFTSAITSAASDFHQQTESYAGYVHTRSHPGPMTSFVESHMGSDRIYSTPTSSDTSSEIISQTNIFPVVTQTHSSAVTYLTTSTEPALSDFIIAINFDGDCRKAVQKRYTGTLNSKMLSFILNATRIEDKSSISVGPAQCSPNRVHISFRHVDKSTVFLNLKRTLSIDRSSVIIRINSLILNLTGFEEVQQTPRRNGESEVTDTDITIIAIASCLCLILLVAGIIIFAKEIYHKKISETFSCTSSPRTPLKTETVALTSVPARNFDDNDVEMNEDRRVDEVYYNNFDDEYSTLAAEHKTTFPTSPQVSKDARKFSESNDSHKSNEMLNSTISSLDRQSNETKKHESPGYGLIIGLMGYTKRLERQQQLKDKKQSQRQLMQQHQQQLKQQTKQRDQESEENDNYAVPQKRSKPSRVKGFSRVAAPRPSSAPTYYSPPESTIMEEPPSPPPRHIRAARDLPNSKRVSTSNEELLPIGGEFKVNVMNSGSPTFGGVDNPLFSDETDNVAVDTDQTFHF